MQVKKRGISGRIKLSYEQWLINGTETTNHQNKAY